MKSVGPQNQYYFSGELLLLTASSWLHGATSLAIDVRPGSCSHRVLPIPPKSARCKSKTVAFRTGQCDSLGEK